MRKLFKITLSISLFATLLIAGVSCTKGEFTDGERFLLFYHDITDIGPSASMSIEPSYHGAKPENFQITKVKFQGNDYQTECFSVDRETGVFYVGQTQDLPVGVYSISISCMSSGKTYVFSDLIRVNMMKPVPDGIMMEPSRIELLMTQVNNVNSEEVLPTSSVVTDGDHMSIKSYKIANVWREGKKMEDWTPYFTIDELTGQVSIIKNQTFSAGVYVMDLRLVTAIVGAADEEGLFEKALTVDIISPPVELSYDPKVKRVEEGAGYISAEPYFVASTKDLVFSIKAVYPENLPVTIDEHTGQIILDQSHGLVTGDQVMISVRMTNAYGVRDFDLIHKLEIVKFITPISKFSYNDSTVWHGTAFNLKPLEMDGDEVTYEFVDLPQELSGLAIDRQTGVVSAAKGNQMPVGEYTVNVKVSNDKGEMPEEIQFDIVENPYFFTKISWGNNIGLEVSEYASQHRIKGNTDVSVAVDKENSNLTTWDKMHYEIAGGTYSVEGLASVDSETGTITVCPSKLTTMASKRVHAVIVKITSGVGTSGETTRKIPVFFDFNAPRQSTSNKNAPVYLVECTPFVFQCNPKTGGTYPAPAILNTDGSPVSDAEMAKIKMTYMRNAKYFNVEGPDTHVDGSPKTDGTFLNGLWKNYYTGSDQAIPSSLNNVIPVYTYLTSKYTKYRFAYINKDNLNLIIAANKWVDSNGDYADGIFEAEVIMGYPYLNGYKDEEGLDCYDIAKSSSSNYKVDYKGKDPYKLYPFLIWFDTEF